MKSRVIGIIKFEAPRTGGLDRHGGLNFSAGEDELALESWLAALVAGGEEEASSPWRDRGRIVPAARYVRANLERLTEDLDREYLQLAAS